MPLFISAQLGKNMFAQLTKNANKYLFLYINVKLALQYTKTL